MGRGEDGTAGMPRVGFFVNAFWKVRHNSLLQNYDGKTMIDECQVNSDRCSGVPFARQLHRTVRLHGGPCESPPAIYVRHDKTLHPCCWATFRFSISQIRLGQFRVDCLRNLGHVQ